VSVCERIESLRGFAFLLDSGRRGEDPYTTFSTVAVESIVRVE